MNWVAFLVLLGIIVIPLAVLFIVLEVWGPDEDHCPYCNGVRCELKTSLTEHVSECCSDDMKDKEVAE